MYRATEPVDRRYIDGRPPQVAAAPGAHHAFVAVPNLKALREAKGLTFEQAADITTYGKSVLEAAENGAELPRIVVSRLTAELGLSHAAAKAEI